MSSSEGERIRPLNRLWQMIGRFLSKITGPIVLALVFYAVVTPIGVMLRALGKDPLRLRRNAAAVSYWIKRSSPGSPLEALKDRF
jgi:hypothetical protein